MSEPLVDPLRVHTYGVKRPLEEKKGEIEKLYKDHKRYYPTDKKGDIDEWGAVIKNQNEMFTRLADAGKLQKKKFMEEYANELSNESDKRVREQKYNEMQQKQEELFQALTKKREADVLNQKTLESKKSIQNVLAQDYENAMRLRKMQQDDERRKDLMAGQVTNSKAQHELNYFRKAEEDKKKMIRQILNNEKQAYDDRKKMNSQSQVMSTDEARKYFEENERKERLRDYQNAHKYNNFNNFQNQIGRSYNEHVAKPEMDKQSKLNQIIKKQEAELKRR